MTYQNNELYHFGVKGMKWGVRHQKKNAKNPNYTEKQRRQDRAMYGKRAEKRINRRMNEGYGVLGARSLEVKRKNRIKVGTAIATSVLGYVGYDYLYNGGRNTKAAINLGKNVANKIVKDADSRGSGKIRTALWKHQMRKNGFNI